MNNRHFLLLSLAVPSISAGALQAQLVAYWSFDEYNETGDNPPGTPQGNHEGWFEDLSGNDHKAYAADLTNGNYVPMDAGKSGNAFYSKSPSSDAQRGAMAVVPHTDLINFDEEDFTISFWEKVAFRDVASSGWAPGRGRTQWFMKAPYMPAGAVGSEGYGLNLTQNRFDFVSNNTDNFGQTGLGATYTYPPGSEADDSGKWAHWAITGSFDPASDDYTVTVYLNGQAVDWNGATGTTFTVPNATIDNEGDLTLGGFFRNNSWSHQRFLSWNMSDGAGDGEGWMDDFAMWSTLLTEDQIASLAEGSANPLTVLGGGPRFEFDEVAYDANANSLVLNWPSRQGKLYTLRSETDPSSSPPIDWPVFDGQQDLPATPPRNSLSLPLPAEASRFFVVEEFDAPPLTVFSDDFESGQGGWSTGTDGPPDTLWEFGTPTSGPGAASSPVNCFATNLDSDYATNSNVWLRSPAIDLTTASGATLVYSQWTEIEESFDLGRVSLLDATDDSVLAVIHDVVEGNTTSWEQITSALPPEGLGKIVKIEFRFLSDEFQVLAGWYLDDVSVTVP